MSNSDDLQKKIARLEEKNERYIRIIDRIENAYHQQLEVSMRRMVGVVLKAAKRRNVIISDEDIASFNMDSLEVTPDGERIKYSLKKDVE